MKIIPPKAAPPFCTPRSSLTANGCHRAARPRLAAGTRPRSWTCWDIPRLMSRPCANRVSCFPPIPHRAPDHCTSPQPSWPKAAPATSAASSQRKGPGKSRCFGVGTAPRRLVDLPEIRTQTHGVFRYSSRAGEPRRLPHHPTDGRAALAIPCHQPLGLFPHQHRPQIMHRQQQCVRHLVQLRIRRP
jgi:hypothetical protein